MDDYLATFDQEIEARFEPRFTFRLDPLDPVRRVTYRRIPR